MLNLQPPGDVGPGLLLEDAAGVFGELAHHDDRDEHPPILLLEGERVGAAEAEVGPGALTGLIAEERIVVADHPEALDPDHGSVHMEVRPQSETLPVRTSTERASISNSTPGARFGIQTWMPGASGGITL